ncbi:NAD-dependent epimerase/dehydratase family protein [Nocardioides mangrovicus]|uniref:NAD-dependent epimerase/dehydratase family protein n=1 Tax=Nocardioides mangrovicus TaxID=2478913 RepID=A0A3L8NY43_9ACTN|nr:NAD-dependent epimerase/dehydratase family protein [Nocardioides mangrovicus]RLV48060.1 NAD-dependent epimerase/dehydratase family protein [Nocardioides mangrovicus]
MERVVVTGGTGFVGAHVAARLMRDDEHEVLVTVRTPEQEQVAIALAKRGGVNPDIVDELEVEVADLGSEEGWADAFEDADYVVHAASPSVDGVRRVLAAAREAGVRRVVLVSCFGAVAYGQPERSAPFTEADWTDVDGAGVTESQRTSTLAERAAWDAVGAEGLELVVLAPVTLWGPVLSKEPPLTGRIALTMLKGGLPFVGPVRSNLLDVRDLADLALRAMTHPDAAGRRFVATSGEPVALSAVAKQMGVRSVKVPRWASRKDAPELVELAETMGDPRPADASVAQRLLGWQPRPVEKTVRDTASSLRDLGLLSPSFEESLREFR